MDSKTVFTKTAKGITQVNQRSASLSRDLMKILKLIDGKSNFGEIMERADLDKPSLDKAVSTLIKDGFARVFETRKDPDPFGEDDFDFTAPGKLPGQTQRVVAAAANDISELVRQQEKAEAEKKAREQAQVVAREKAKQQAEARATAEAEAKARAEAEQRAMEQARRAKEAADRAKAELEAKLREEEARRRAVAEQQAKLAAEQKLKEEEEARKIAELRARSAAEANARAKAELEAKVREEEARKRVIAEEQARAAAAERVKEEEEAQLLAEARAKAEREARALADARARAEAEAQALAKARAEAEAAVKRQAVEAVASEKELKARLKEEIETRIRAEMETLLRDEIEEKARAEMQAKIMAEARLAAKAELEERLREERALLQKAEMEMRVTAEKAARERAEQEAKLRAEAEARADSESAAREKAEEETRRLRRLEARAREEAEVAAREKQETAVRSQREREEAQRRHEAEKREAEKRLDVERQAKIEAEARAMVEAEERERSEKELGGKIESERRAREEAEKRARIEARARETVEETTREKVKAEIEGDMTRRAELEGKAQAKAYMQAKQQAELDEDSRIRSEQERKAREIAEVLRTKVEPDQPDPATPAKRRYRRRGSFLKPALFTLGGLLIVGLGLLHVVPLRPLSVKLEKGIGGWMQEEVSIDGLKFSLLPSPHLKFDAVTAGKLREAKASHGRVFLDIPALLSDKVVINSLELENVSIAGDATRRILGWGTHTQAKSASAEIDQVRLKSVKLDVKPAIPPFDATIAFGKDARFRGATLSGEGKWTATVRPRENVYDVTFGARNWALPLGAPVPVSDVNAKGVLTENDLTFSEFEADALEGKVNGTLQVSWGPVVRMASELSLARVRAELLMQSFTRDVAVTGKLEGNFSVTAESPTLAALLSTPRVQGKFRLADGSVSNADLVAAMQSSDAAGRAGVTKFAELTGEFSTADGRAAWRNLVLQGGVLRGGGSLDVAASGALSGRLSVEIRSNVAQDRGAFNVSGTVAKPILRRGG